MITPTDTTAASASARKWMIFPSMTERSQSSGLTPLPCRTFMPINGTGWVEERRDGLKRASSGEKSNRVCSHPNFGMFSPRIKASVTIAPFEPFPEHWNVCFCRLYWAYSCLLQRKVFWLPHLTIMTIILVLSEIDGACSCRGLSRYLCLCLMLFTHTGTLT